MTAVKLQIVWCADYNVSNMNENKYKTIKALKKFFIPLKNISGIIHFWISGLAGSKSFNLNIHHCFKFHSLPSKSCSTPSSRLCQGDHFLNHMSSKLGLRRCPIWLLHPHPEDVFFQLHLANCPLPSILRDTLFILLPGFLPEDQHLALRPIFLNQLHQGWLTALCII